MLRDDRRDAYRCYEVLLFLLMQFHLDAEEGTQEDQGIQCINVTKKRVLSRRIDSDRLRSARIVCQQKAPK
jgi:hypothetical protein